MGILDWLKERVYRCRGIEQQEKKDYEFLEKIAVENSREKTNIAKIADDLDELGFKTEISSEGGVDRSDLVLKVRKVKRDG